LLQQENSAVVGCHMLSLFAGYTVQQNLLSKTKYQMQQPV